MKSPFYWYRQYNTIISDLLRQYDRVATPKQWRHARMSFILMALFGRNKPRYLNWLKSIHIDTDSDNGFLALLYFAHINSVFYRTISIIPGIGPIFLIYYLWFSYYDHVSVALYSNSVVVAATWVLIVYGSTTKFIHRMNDTAVVKLLGLFL